MDYIILHEESADMDKAAKELQEAVKWKLKNGYELQGGVTLSKSAHGYQDWYAFAQAMIKK